jgi:hypothetical protein
VYVDFPLIFLLALSSMLYVLQTIPSVGMWAAKKLLPAGQLQTLEEQAEAVNTPRMGCQENFMWANQQINVAPIQPHDSGVSLFVLVEPRSFRHWF